MSVSTIAPTPDRPFETDPAEWSIYHARMICVALDWGSRQDHSAIAVAAAYDWQGSPLISVPFLRRFDLGTPVADVLRELTNVVTKFSTHGTEPAIVVDARSNLPLLEAACAHGFKHLPLGVSATGAAMHALSPSLVQVVNPKGKRVMAKLYTVSRNAMLDALSRYMGFDQLCVTETGDADVLQAEMGTLQREVTAARNVRFTTPAGTHDDLVTALGYAVWGTEWLQPRRNHATVKRAPKPSVRAWS